MSFRGRLLLASIPMALVPLILFGLGARRDVTRRLETQYAERVAALADVVAAEVGRESASVAERLGRVVEAMGADNRLRVALRDAESGVATADRAYLLDYAPRAMPLAGFDVLRVQSADGRVLTSGHFRNEYGAVDTVLISVLARRPEEAVLAEIASPAGTDVALVRAAPLRVGAAVYTVVAGVRVDEAFVERLAGGSGLEVRLDREESAAGAPGRVREVPVPFVSAAGESAARFVVSASDEPLAALRSDLDRWLVGAVVLAALLATVLAAFAAGQLSEPLAELARRAGRVDLDRLDESFASERTDEIGDLSRVLGRMTGRLRTSAARVRDAERRATTGDIARQVHHDVRNGLIPIRNVLAHLTQVARENPERTADVLLERQGTLDSSVSYLQSLASNYARLSPAAERRECDVNRIVRDVVSDAGTVASNGTRIDADLASSLPPVVGDPVALRRILENLVVNAVESLDGAPGAGARVRVSTRPGWGDDGSPLVLLSVSDSGRGMTPEERARMFDDFYTTKAHGTGLGLSIVRRLVSDMGGRIEVESAPGEGTVVVVELQA